MLLYVAGTLFAFDDDEQRQQEKFEKIYLQYGRLMYSKAYEILKDHALSEDAVSEAFIRIFKNLYKLSDTVPCPETASFVVVVVRNVSLTMIEKQRYSLQVSIEDEEFNIPDGIDMEEDILSQISSQEIMNLVESLGEDIRQVFLLYYGYDMSLAQIAQTLDITANLAGVRLHRARKKLAKMIGKEF
ncbi:MAG: sigma-70 family RNA polymerase sigma factor [Ruminococcaceae bacterium]|nr:sigma-70 family RNA polymerase sigma factor [Oscillospiraceae bacterium]